MTDKELELEMIEHCLSLAKIELSVKGNLESYIKHLENLINERRANNK